MAATTGKLGCIAAGHAATAEAGVAILREGGNAVDAAVAAVCTSFIAEPVLTGAGGGGFLLVRNMAGQALLYDGFARMPAMPVSMLPTPDFRAIPVDFGDTIQNFHIGQASIATPSLLAMLFACHKAHGRLPLLETLKPAIDAAKSGIALNALQASFISLLKPILTAEQNCRRLHAPGDELLKAGETFRNPDLANTLEMLAIEGIEEMYHGDLAREIVRACSPNGLLGMDDLSSEQVIVRQPLRLPAWGGELITNPPPSSGGTLIAFTLHLFESAVKAFPGLPENLLLAECMHATSRARSEDFDSAVHMPGVEQKFLSSKRWQHALECIRQRLNGLDTTSAHEAPNRHGSTTQVSIIDGDGMAVSITSSNGEGSGIVVPGTGIHLNNMLGEEDINPSGFHRLPAGTTLSSMMAPSMFITDGKPALVLGSGGSNRIRSAMLQVIRNHLLDDQHIEEAVCRGRLHTEGNGLLDVEPDTLDQQSRDKLTGLGWQIRDWQSPSIYFGGVHAVCMDRNGDLHGAGDPRRGGYVAWT